MGVRVCARYDEIMIPQPGHTSSSSTARNERRDAACGNGGALTTLMVVMMLFIRALMPTRSTLLCGQLLSVI